MDNSKQPDQRRTIGQIIASLDHRLTALEQASAGTQSQETVSAGVSGSGAQAPDDRLESLATELSAQADNLRDIETGLVGRIADVDDDRRRTAATLQRALETHQEEVEVRLRRRGGWTLALLILAILLIPLAFWLGMRQAAVGGAGVSDELVRIREEVARLSANGGEDDPLRERLTGLSEVVSDISASLERLGTEQERGVEAMFDRERNERQAADVGLIDRLARMERVQDGLRQEVDALVSRVAELATQGAGARTSEAMTDAVPAGETSDRESMAAAEVEPAEAERAPASEPPEPAAAAEESPAGAVTLDERRFALQLIGFFSLDELRRFSDGHDMPADAYFRQEILRGRPWYVLIHSLHESYDGAAAERSRLPPELAALDIWIRPLPDGTELQVLESSVDASPD